MEVPSIFLNRILSEMAKRGASDMHLTVGSIPIIRINNQLSSLAGEEIVTNEILNKVIDTFISPEELTKLKENREIILVKNLAGNFRFRLNIFYQKDLLSLTFHYIPGNLKTLAELKIPKIFQDFMNADSGLLIIGGPYGAGKTTTAAAFIEEVNKTYNKSIITIEDPIEFLFVSKKSIIVQRQIGHDVKSFSQGLEYCLNEDVDLVYVSELKKEEDFITSMPLILELASGNSLVVLEINANSSIRVLEKILTSASKTMSAESARYNLVDNLLAVIVQKLIPRRGGGMALASEILLNNSAVKSIIREGKIYQLESVMQTSRKEGMISLTKSIEELIKVGEIKQEDVT